ncbi:MAG: hypothetical protein JSS14_22170 [Proteobacteria bacterium]|nr:hypothetical protein [Pseudomonadota bacterium]
MTPARLARLESSLNGTARKVLSAVPLQEPWSKEQIMSELRRVGSSLSPDAMVGSLNFMTDRGLVKEAERGKFIRIQARLIENQPEPEEMQTVTLKQVPKQGVPKTDVLTRLAGLASDLRTIATEIDAVALDVEERFAAIQKDSEKLRQFTELLKSLGT